LVPKVVDWTGVKIESYSPAGVESCSRTARTPTHGRAGRRRMGARVEEADLGAAVRGQTGDQLVAGLVAAVDDRIGRAHGVDLDPLRKNSLP
jgi:hypothetical protein